MLPSSLSQPEDQSSSPAPVDEFLEPFGVLGGRFSVDLQIGLAKALESRLDALFAIVRLQAFQRVPDPCGVPLLVLHYLADPPLGFGTRARHRTDGRVVPDA